MTVDIEIGTRTARFTSDLDHRLRDALLAVGCPKQRDHRAKCWLVPVDHASDVIAYLEFSMNATVTVRSTGG